MRAWLTIDGVEFVTDEWKTGDKVFSLILRPVGTRPPGMEWCFSEGVWKGGNPAPEYLVEVDKVEVEQEGVDGKQIQQLEIVRPLWGHPEAVNEFVGEIQANCLEDFARKLDSARAVFEGYGKESFSFKDGKVRLMPPFFDKTAAFNKNEEKDAKVPSADDRRRDDIRTFLEVISPGNGRDPRAGVLEGAWWKKPIPRNWNEFRNGAEWKGWTGGFGELAQAIARREEENKTAYDAAKDKWKSRMLWVARGGAVAVALALLAWGAWCIDGSKAGKIRQLTKSGKFVQAAKAGTGFFFYGKGQARVTGALLNNKREFELWIEGKKGEYEMAKRESRWADAKGLGEEIAGNGGRKPEDWDEVALLVRIEAARDVAKRKYLVAREHGGREELEEAIATIGECRKMFTPGAKRLDGRLYSEIEGLLRDAEAWGLKEKMDRETAAFQWAEAESTAGTLLGRNGLDPQIRQLAETVLRKCKSLEPRYAGLASLAADPERYFGGLERLRADYGEAMVLELLKKDQSGAFRTVMVKLLAPSIQAAHGGRALPGGAAPKVQWVLWAEEAGVKGLELVSGWLRYYGVGCEMDAERAARHFEAAATAEKGLQGQSGFMAGVVRAEQGQPAVASQWMRIAEKVGVLEAAAVLMGKGELPATDERTLLAATNLPSVRTAYAVMRLGLGQREEGVAILKRVVQTGHYPPAELWLSAMVGESDPAAKVFYRKNVAAGVSDRYPRPFTKYPAVMARWTSLDRTQSDSYVIEELLAKGADRNAKVDALEGALERGALWTVGILLSANTLSTASAEQVARVLSMALVQEDPHDLLWCCLRVAAEHWADSRKTDVIASMQGCPEVVRNKARRLFGMAPERAVSTPQRKSRFKWW